MRYKPSFPLFFLLTIFLLQASISFTQAETISPEQAHQFIGQIKTVCGTVVNTKYAIYSRGQPTFLNLNRPYPNHIFTAVIWGSERHKFKSPPETYYKGKRICVSGMITSYRSKPQIFIRDHSQIIVKSTLPQSKSIENQDNYYERYSKDERKILKAILVVLGYSTDYEDHKWDDRSGKAVRSFQRDNKLVADGKIGPKTLRVMSKAILKCNKIQKEDTYKVSLYLSKLASREESHYRYIKPKTYSVPRYSSPQPYYGYSSDDKIEEGDDVEYYEYESGEYRYGTVESIDGGEVEVYDNETGEYHYVDIDDIE